MLTIDGIFDKIKELIVNIFQIRKGIVVMFLKNKPLSDLCMDEMI